MTHPASKWLGRADSCCRAFVACLMLIYGLAKIFQAQFYADYHWLDRPLGELDGMQLTWSFFAHSPLYERSLGLVEVLVGALFLSRRSTTLGVVLFVPLIANLVALNVFYEIGALASALPLSLAGLFLLARRWGQLRNFFWDPAQPMATGARSPWPALSVCILAAGIASALIYNNKYRFDQDRALSGAWEFEDVQPQARRIYFEKGRSLALRDVHGGLQFTQYRLIAPGRVAIEACEALPNLADASYRIEGDVLTLASSSAEFRLRRVAVNVAQATR